jgi:hypothetical protein
MRKCIHFGSKTWKRDSVGQTVSVSMNIYYVEHAKACL